MLGGVWEMKSVKVSGSSFFLPGEEEIRDKHTASTACSAPSGSLENQETRTQLVPSPVENLVPGSMFDPEFLHFLNMLHTVMFGSHGLLTIASDA